MIELWMQTPHGIVSKPFELPPNQGIRSLKVHDMLYDLSKKHEVHELWVRRMERWVNEDFNWLRWGYTGVFSTKYRDVPDEFKLAILLKG